MRRALVVGLVLCATACFDGTYHPDGWDDAETHGRATRLQEEDCTLCHGEQLEGGVADEACDSCHTPQWETTCNYCHGALTDPTGMPPRELNSNMDAALGSFPAHAAHADSDDHKAIACDACHVQPDAALSPGHVFDDTPGRAEVVFGPMNPEGTYDGAGQGASCANLYCHGNGKAPGAAVLNDPFEKGCDGCHGGRTPSAGSTLAGAHLVHLGEEGITCGSCHAGVLQGDEAITQADLHVNGLIEVQFAEAGITQDGDLCSGTCHDHEHSGFSWSEGRHHPESWATDRTLHGPVAKRQEEDCRECHGDDLTGGTTGIDCDSCHREEPRIACDNCDDWRVNCDFCHEPSGVLRGRPGLTSAFADHEAHVPMAQNHGGFDCVQCHTDHADVLSPGHMFDDTPGRAETHFADGLSTRGVYDGAGECSNLYCHGTGRGDNGAYASGDPMPSCSTCHADTTSRTRWGTMSGEHREHLGEGVRCYECHSQVTNQGLDILAADLHVNGQPDVHIREAGITRNGSRCSGSCHGEGHNNESW